MSGRQKRWREATRSAGLVEVTVIVPADRADELRAYAEELRAGRAPRAARRPRQDPAQLGMLDALDAAGGPPPDSAAPQAPAHQRDGGADRAPGAAKGRSPR